MPLATAFSRGDLYKAWKMPKNQILRLNPQVSFVILSLARAETPENSKEDY